MTTVRLAGTRSGLVTGHPETVPLVLSFIAGLVDVTSFVLLDGLFAAHVTGNVVVLAADFATHRPVRLTAVLAVVVFIVVTAVLTAAVDRRPRRPYTWAARFLWLQFALLTGTAFVSVALDASRGPGSSTEVVTAVLAVAAMASQNALLHLTFNRAPSTAVMTGNIVASTVALVGLALSRVGRSAADGPAAGRTSDRSDWRALWPLLLGFVTGCVVGAIASEAAPSWAWTVPALVSGMVAAAVSRVGLPVEFRREV